MTHELKKIIETAYCDQRNGIKNVLVTVVFLEGSSYRKPGVRMLISAAGKITGAVSGGCIEKEIQHRAQSVFKSGVPKMMTYDGRYRLGCEGILYLLMEPFFINEDLYLKFQDALNSRDHFEISSYYQREDECTGNFGSIIKFKDHSSFKFNEHLNDTNLENSEKFTQNLNPIFKLVIIGGEHDAVKLCTMAVLLGWEVDVITSVKDPKKLSDFPGAKNVSAQTPEITVFDLDANTAVVLMTHNYAQDLKYLLKLKNFNLNYIGILGSEKRREQLFDDLMEMETDLSEDFLDKIHSPAGLNIGAITPEEIALSILSEILHIIRATQIVEMQNITDKNQADQ